jgi:abortive infection bacteriophage resistance protein
MDVKNPVSYEEQIAVMRKRGCSVKDEAAAVRFLKRVGYYRFSGYLVAYRQADGNYSDGLSFEKASSVYDFDQNLRGIISKAVSDVEITAKSIISYYHAHRYGSLGYLDTSNFGKVHDHERFTEKLVSSIENNKNALFVRHHIKTYGGKFPVWVAVELFTMSMISIFFADLVTGDKKTIAKEYNTDYAHLESWLHSTSVLRNICAHYGRLYNTRFHQNPKLPREYAKYADMNIRSLFKQMYMLKMLHSNHRVDWNNSVVSPLSALIEKHERAIDVNSMGFPENWEDALVWEGGR